MFVVPLFLSMTRWTYFSVQENGRKLVGQCNISHPTHSSSSFHASLASPIEDFSEVESANDHEQSGTANLVFSKDDESPYSVLESRINRTFDPSNLIRESLILSEGLYYINAHGHEIHPSPNPEFLAQCATKDVLVYSCGSLWTRCDSLGSDLFSSLNITLVL